MTLSRIEKVSWPDVKTFKTATTKTLETTKLKYRHCPNRKKRLEICFMCTHLYVATTTTTTTMVETSLNKYFSHIRWIARLSTTTEPTTTTTTEIAYLNNLFSHIRWIRRLITTTAPTAALA